MKRMVVDTANILFRVAAAHGKYNQSGTPEEQAGLALHMALNTLNKYFKKFKPDEMAVTFEGTNNWRKEYTKSSKCLSGKVYKANRVKDSSMEPFFELIRAFEDLARNHTSLICLSNPVLEGDDLFGGYVLKHTANGDEVIGVSGDRDFVQFCDIPGFTLINPDTGKPRTLLDTCGKDDGEFFMFEKGMRGDKGDNVFPAYPRLRKARMELALKDEYEMTKLMNETWSVTDEETAVVKEFVVGELFKENQTLMNLRGQPDDIKEIIQLVLEHESANHGKWNFFQFTKFCGKYGLKQIAENAQQFADMFGMTPESQALKAEKAKKKAIMEF